MEIIAGGPLTQAVRALRSCQAVAGGMRAFLTHLPRVTVSMTVFVAADTSAEERRQVEAAVTSYFTSSGWTGRCWKEPGRRAGGNAQLPILQFVVVPALPKRWVGGRNEGLGAMQND